MALSQDEQRVLAEIERRLAAEDPRLASCLATFRRPRPSSVLRSPRARIIGSLFTVLLVAMVSMMVYAMIPFRDHGVRTPPSPTAAYQGRTAFSSAASAGQKVTHQASADASGGVTGNTSPSAPGSAAPSSKTTTIRAHGTPTGQATGRSTPSTGP
jgi:Protein of unknown function (DUF3040)